MRVEPVETLEARSRDEWRKWLKENRDSRSEIRLVFHKRNSGVTSLGYGDAVEEALCFGWIDSLVRRLDEARYARQFTPRKAGSRWSTMNRRLYADLKSRGLLAAPGLKRAPASLSGDTPRPDLSAGPACIEEALKTHPRAWRYFARLAPSYRRAYIGWIEPAKRDVTKDERLREALKLLASGKKLGLE